MKITTFLLDLDDTLLGNPMSNFLPAYFAGIERRLNHFTQGQDIRKLMSAAVQVMQANKDPAVTNMQAFMTEFSKLLGVPGDALLPDIEAFYREDYPQLQRLTTCRPEAKEIVRHLLASGYKVVIATNPLFPATAIEQRLVWAKINTLDGALVTTMENSHFSKPDPLYYQEILAKIDSKPDETWMVGDDPQNDIIPAGSLGIKTWWVVASKQSGAGKISYDKAGDLAQFWDWLRGYASVSQP